MSFLRLYTASINRRYLAWNRMKTLRSRFFLFPAGQSAKCEGRNIRDSAVDAIKAIATVRGITRRNFPMRPGSIIRGRNAATVVAVASITGTAT